MNSLSGCKAILFDFGGTLDSDGEHWLDRFYELYEMAGLDLPRHEIKRVFYSADERCCEDPRVNELGLRPLMGHHVHLQFLDLGLRTRERNGSSLSGSAPRRRISCGGIPNCSSV